MEKLLVDEIQIEYELKYSTRIKKMKITVEQGLVKVTVPKGVPRKLIRKFVEDNKEWIIKHVRTYNSNSVINRKYVTGEKLLFLGQQYLLDVSELSSLSSDQIRSLLVYWYKEQAYNYLSQRLDYFAKVMNLNYNQLKIKEQKTRWGSCSSKRNINLNWKIIMAPPVIIDYLIVHELAHLLVMNHSEQFWSVVEKYLPNYKYCREWLKRHGRELEV